LAGAADGKSLVQILLQAEPIAIALNGVGERPFPKAKGSEELLAA
jgi:hypothetical protein